MNYQEKVRLFQIASGQPVSDTPRQLTKEEYEFRDNLLREEIRELQYAIVDNNRVEILDALCDIKYVNDGTANAEGWYQDDGINESDYNGWGMFQSNNLIIKDNMELLSIVNSKDCDMINESVYCLAYAFGFTLENFKAALDRVHESNMSKFCHDIKTAERTQDFYKKQGIDTYIEPRNKMTVVYRKGDGKVLKSVDYHPVYLDDLVMTIDGKEVKP